MKLSMICIKFHQKYRFKKLKSDLWGFKGF